MSGAAAGRWPASASSAGPRRALAPKRLTIDDVREAARQQGVRSFADVDLAVPEPSGAASFFQRQDNGDSGAPETAASAIT